MFVRVSSLGQGRHGCKEHWRQRQTDRERQRSRVRVRGTMFAKSVGGRDRDRDRDRGTETETERQRQRVRTHPPCLAQSVLTSKALHLQERIKGEQETLQNEQRISCITTASRVENASFRLCRNLTHIELLSRSLSQGTEIWVQGPEFTE